MFSFGYFQPCASVWAGQAGFQHLERATQVQIQHVTDTAIIPWLSLFFFHVPTCPSPRCSSLPLNCILMLLMPPPPSHTHACLSILTTITSHHPYPSPTDFSLSYLYANSPFSLTQILDTDTYELPHPSTLSCQGPQCTWCLASWASPGTPCHWTVRVEWVLSSEFDLMTHSRSP